MTEFVYGLVISNAPWVWWSILFVSIAACGDMLLGIKTVRQFVYDYQHGESLV